MMAGRKLRRLRREVPENTTWKLMILADWLDSQDRIAGKDPSQHDSSVQDDLRSLAAALAPILGESG